jgi:hypothetical protein
MYPEQSPRRTGAESATDYLTCAPQEQNRIDSLGPD